MGGVAALKKVHHHHQDDVYSKKEKLNNVLNELYKAEQQSEVLHETNRGWSPAFTLLQPSEDNQYQRNVLQDNGYVWVSGRDITGGKQEGFLQKPTKDELKSGAKSGANPKEVYEAKVESFKKWFPLPKPTTLYAQKPTPKAPDHDSKNSARIGGFAGRNLAAEINPAKEEIKPNLDTPNAKASAAAAGKDLIDQRFLTALEIQTAPRPSVAEKPAPRPAVAEKTPPRPRMSEGKFLQYLKLGTPTEISLEVEGKHVILPLGEASGSWRTYIPARLSPDEDFSARGSELPPRDVLFVKGNLVKRGDLESYVKGEFSAAQASAILRTIEASQPK